MLMLAHARVLGYVFNPLTVFWCHRADGTLACVIAEVHNTYGQRHAYLVHTDDRGRARMEKALYVSPYHPVDGWYQMSLPRPGERLALSVTLHRPNGHRFVASVRGTAVPATRPALLRAAARHPWSTAMVSARIRLAGDQVVRARAAAGAATAAQSERGGSVTSTQARHQPGRSTPEPVARRRRGARVGGARGDRPRCSSARRCPGFPIRVRLPDGRASAPGAPARRSWWCTTRPPSSPGSAPAG